MSHSLPDEVAGRLQALIWSMEEGLQADGHAVGKGMAAHAAFDQQCVGSHLTRALVRAEAVGARVAGVRIESLPNLGCEIVITHEGVTYRFRLRRAEERSSGLLVVSTSSDSFLTKSVRSATLFDDEVVWEAEQDQQWVLAYTINPVTRTFSRIEAGYPTGFANSTSPYRLVMEQRVAFSLAAPTPPSFPGGSDDLDLGEGDPGQQGETA